MGPERGEVGKAVIFVQYFAIIHDKPMVAMDQVIGIADRSVCVSSDDLE